MNRKTIMWLGIGALAIGGFLWYRRKQAEKKEAQRVETGKQQITEVKFNVGKPAPAETAGQAVGKLVMK